MGQEKVEERIEEGSINDLYDLVLCPADLLKRTSVGEVKEDTIGIVDLIHREGRYCVFSQFFHHYAIQHYPAPRAILGSLFHAFPIFPDLLSASHVHVWEVTSTNREAAVCTGYFFGCKTC